MMILRTSVPKVVIINSFTGKLITHEQKPTPATPKPKHNLGSLRNSMQKP